MSWISNAARWIFRRKDAIIETGDFAKEVILALRDGRLTYEEMLLLQRELSQAIKAWRKSH